MGTTGLTAQSSEAQDDDEVRAWLIRGVLIALVVGTFLIFMQIPISLYVFYWTNASDEVLPLALEYFYIRIWCTPTTLLSFVILGWFLGMPPPRCSVYAGCIELFKYRPRSVVCCWLEYGSCWRCKSNINC